MVGFLINISLTRKLRKIFFHSNFFYIFPKLFLKSYIALNSLWTICLGVDIYWNKLISDSCIWHARLKSEDEEDTVAESKWGDGGEGLMN